MNSNYTRLTIDLAAADIETAAAIAHMAVPYGFYVEDYAQLEEEIAAIAHTDLIDADLLAKDRSRGAIHLFIPAEESPAEAVAFLRVRLDAAGIAHTIALADCRAEDWENNWKQYFRPTPVGELLLIIPEWLRAETVPADGRVPLYIDPGLAFGTGSHATTRLCLELLEKNTTPAGEVLDVGCGSGILGIAALLLGAGRVFGVDIDPVAVRAATENAALDGFAPPVYTAAQGVLAEQPAAQYDTVLANIVADVLIPLAADICTRLREDGRLILSGIIEHSEADVTAAYEAHGLRVMERSENDGWVALVMGA
ncbi:MAG: 50S ribosomal protein L11 methyltransferase [Oscillospiraceae bacterium]|nr:50S ribosomal protein L11 methyltransferase [Oscillospiraceae bacterium]